MKENPAMKKVAENMKPGVISLHGFMGNDKRNIELIIDHDAAELERFGVSTEEIADKLEEIKTRALEGLGEYIDISGGYLAKADSVRGKLPCPFTHPGLYRKTLITLKDKNSGDELLFTELGIHLIREHGFFQGKGSPFRLEPSVLAELFSKL
jgi:hypothetical protein